MLADVRLLPSLYHTLQVEYELAKQRRIVEMLTKSLQKEESEKNSFKGANEKLAQTANQLRQANKHLGQKIETLRAELARQPTLTSLEPSVAAAITPPDSASDTSNKGKLIFQLTKGALVSSKSHFQMIPVLVFLVKRPHQASLETFVGPCPVIERVQHSIQAHRRVPGRRQRRGKRLLLK